MHGADLAEALIAAGGTPATSRRIYYASHPDVFTSTRFVRSVAGAMGRSVAVVKVPIGVGRRILAVTETAARLTRHPTILTTDKANEFFQPAWTGDPAPLTRDSGWSAQRDLAAGLSDTWHWYRSAGWVCGRRKGGRAKRRNDAARATPSGGPAAPRLSHDHHGGRGHPGAEATGMLVAASSPRALRSAPLSHSSQAARRNGTGARGDLSAHSAGRVVQRGRDPQRARGVGARWAGPAVGDGGVRRSGESGGGRRCRTGCGLRCCTRRTSRTI